MECIRCHEDFGERHDGRCQECGVHEDRVVRKMRRRRPIGGKRGRNSGKVNTAKSK
jgi:hypothetical protein